MKDPTPSFNVVLTSISKSRDGLNGTSEVSAAFEKALERRPESRSQFTDCRGALLKPKTFIVVDDHFRPSHNFI